MHLVDEHISLWKEVQEGNKQALFELYDDMYFHLIRYGLTVQNDSDLVKDCINQLFLKLWDRHARLNNVENVSSYLFTSLRRLIKDYVSDQNRVSILAHRLRLETEEEPSYEEMIITQEKDKEFKEKLTAAMKTLSPKQVELIRLKFFDNLSYKEIALVSSQSVKTSYNTIYDAIKMLRLKLKM